MLAAFAASMTDDGTRIIRFGALPRETRTEAQAVAAVAGWSGFVDAVGTRQVNGMHHHRSA
jgi:hypothetical protein